MKGKKTLTIIPSAVTIRSGRDEVSVGLNGSSVRVAVGQNAVDIPVGEVGVAVVAQMQALVGAKASSGRRGGKPGSKNKAKEVETTESVESTPEVTEANDTLERFVSGEAQAQ